MQTSTANSPKKPAFEAPEQDIDRGRPPEPPFIMEMFYDEVCPMCRREVAMLRWLDRKGQVKFTDIAAADFRAEDYGKTFDELMAEIHGRLPDGTWLTGVEVFRRVYAVTLFRPLVPLTRLPGIRGLMDWGYRIFARNRVRWFRPCDENCRLPSAESSQPAAR